MYDLWIMRVDGSFWYTRTEYPVQQTYETIDGSVYITFIDPDDNIVAQIYDGDYTGAVVRMVKEGEQPSLPEGKALT